MLTKLLFPEVRGVRVDRVWREGRTLHVVATTTRKRARWCRRRIFCERLPGLVAAWARRTVRLQDRLRGEAFALGGEPGARRAAADGTRVSARTLLRLVRATPPPAIGAVRVLGVDDWSRRKGRDYGTIVVDLEAHRVLDLLPDRTAATLATWLGQHPEVEVVSRDRGGAYAEGARQGAPQAVQVADRWHLLKNVTEVVEAVLRRRHAALRVAAKAAADGARTPPAAVPAAPARPPTRAQQERSARRERRLARYREVVELHAQGCGQRRIAATVGIGRPTVRRFLRAEGFPERLTPTRRASGLQRYEPYLRERWAAGCDNAWQLWRELREQGYPGSASNLRRFLARWRAHPSRPGTKGPRPVAGGAIAPPPIPTYSPRQTAWLLLREQDTLTDQERAYVAQLREGCPEVAGVQALARAFRAVVRDHGSAALATWLAQVRRSETPELRGFADHLRADRAAVEAGLTLPWSQGQTEGQVVDRQRCWRATAGQPPQADQAADVRPRPLRPTPPAGPARHRLTPGRRPGSIGPRPLSPRCRQSPHRVVKRSCGVAAGRRRLGSMQTDVRSGFLVVKTFERLYREYAPRYGLTRDVYALPRIDRAPSRAAPGRTSFGMRQHGAPWPSRIIG